MEKWDSFYFLCGSSAAGLTGLMFIAVTFGSRLVRKDNLDQVNLFHGSVCFHFIEIFLLCCIASAPTAGPHITGIAAIVCGLYRLSRVPQAFASMKRTAMEDAEIDYFDWLISLMLPALSQTAFVIAGIFFLMDSPAAQNIFAANLIALLAVGMYAAWDMVVWLATQIDSAPRR